jgi:hypothetical protein
MYFFSNVFLLLNCVFTSHLCPFNNVFLLNYIKSSSSIWSGTKFMHPSLHMHALGEK